MLFSANVTEMADDVLTIRILLSLKTQSEKITSHHSGQTLTNDFVVKNKNYQYQTRITNTKQNGIENCARFHLFRL